MKLNHAAEKRRIVEILLAAYDAIPNKTPFWEDCIAGHESHVRNLAMKLAGESIASGYLFSKTSYAFCVDSSTRDLLLSAFSRKLRERYGNLTYGV